MKKIFLNHIKYFNKKINDIFCEVVIKISSKKDNKETIIFQAPNINFLENSSYTNKGINEKLKTIYQFIKISTRFGANSTRVEVEFDHKIDENILNTIKQQLILSSYEIIEEDSYFIPNKHIKSYYLKWINKEIKFINNKNDGIIINEK